MQGILNNVCIQLKHYFLSITLSDAKQYLSIFPLLTIFGYFLAAILYLFLWHVMLKCIDSEALCSSAIRTRYIVYAHALTSTSAVCNNFCQNLRESKYCPASNSY